VALNAGFGERKRPYLLPVFSAGEANLRITAGYELLRLSMSLKPGAYEPAAIEPTKIERRSILISISVAYVAPALVGSTTCLQQEAFQLRTEKPRDRDNSLT
jgi:hypothetical protein